jgi:hypothetical protein
VRELKRSATWWDDETVRNGSADDLLGEMDDHKTIQVML